MAKYYLITENFMSNNSSLITNDRSEYFCDLGSPQTSVAKDIDITEELSVQCTRDFHFIGEIVCSKAISKIIAQFNPYKCLFLPAVVSDGQDSKADFALLSLENIQECADMDKSEIVNVPRINLIHVSELYLDLELLDKLPEYKRQLFIIEETPDRIIVSKELGEALIAYRETVANSSLSIRPVSDDGRVPEIY